MRVYGGIDPYIILGATSQLVCNKALKSQSLLPLQNDKNRIQRADKEKDAMVVGTFSGCHA
jgi:hypothetical protein